MDTKFYSENLKGRNHLREPRRRYDLKETGYVHRARQPQDWVYVGSCEHGNELSGYISFS
jgi:hypothetical protein